MSGNVAVVYTGDLGGVAEAFTESAAQVAAEVRVLQLEGEAAPAAGAHRSPTLRDLEWADGIAFGTPARRGVPAPELMQFLEGTEPLWSGGRLFDKAVTVITDEPERIAPDALLQPIYNVLYRWGGVIVGPRRFELDIHARGGRLHSGGSSPLPPARLRTAQYRAVRFARLAGVLADERARRSQLER